MINDATLFFYERKSEFMTAIQEKNGYKNEVLKLGFEQVFKSKSGSLYFHKFFKNKSVTVRISDHNIPETEERNEGKSCYDYELLYDQGYEDDNKETLEFLKWLEDNSCA